MDFVLQRLFVTQRSTIGLIQWPTARGLVPLCYALEDVVRPVKVPGATAIPAGRYEVIINVSMRFRRPLPLLLAVPNYAGVRIHTGNTAEDTEGCILPGMMAGLDQVAESKTAFDRLYSYLQEALRKDQVFLVVRSPGPSPEP
jgi:hypothetical protein